MATPRRRSSTRRRAPARSRQRSGGSRGAMLVLALAVIVLTGFNWLAARPGLALALMIGLLVAAVGTGTLWLAWRRARLHRRRELTRSIAAADRLTGPEFEQWVADLLCRTGFTDVNVNGGAGDLGADITARAPDGRLVVLQCKRYAIDRSVGSPDLQRFAGTAERLHGADIAAIVTTTRFTGPAISNAPRLGIRLVDRDSLARWAADGLPPVALAHHTTPGPPTDRGPSDSHRRT